MKIKNFILLYGVGMVVGLYTTFVLTVLWNWFVVPTFNLSAISFWVMYGLTLLVGLFQSPGRDTDAEHRHKIVDVMLDACVPDEKRQQVMEQLKEFTDEIWYEAGWKVFGQIFVKSFTLGIGFVVRNFLAY